MSYLFLLIVAGLATWQAVEAWHHGSIFAAAREWLRERGGFLAELMGCPFCLSHWVAAAVAAILLLAADGPRTESLAMWLPLSLAVARLANLGNDLTHGRCRTPKEMVLPAETRFELPAAEPEDTPKAEPATIVLNIDPKKPPKVKRRWSWHRSDIEGRSAGIHD